MTTISFKDLQGYLDAIATNTGIPNPPPHTAFWKKTYTDFTTGVVPNVTCNDGSPVKIMNHAEPLNSAFYKILCDPLGFCGNPQMPAGGPFITDPGIMITLADGSTITGQAIKENIAIWLGHNFPELATDY